MKIQDLRAKTNAELEFDLGRMQKELFDQRFKSSTDATAQPARIRGLRRDLARIHTLLLERTQKIRGQEPR